MDITALSEMLKARVVKYIRRVPKPSGKGFYYFYNKADYNRYMKTGDAGEQSGHGTFFDAIKSFFGVQSDKEISEAVKREYAAHDIKGRFGLSVFEFTDHLAEYFTNRDKWNTFFTRKKAAEPKKKGKEKQKNSKKDMKKKVKSGGKSFAFPVMKFIFETYGGKTALTGGTNGQDSHRTQPGTVSGNQQTVQSRRNKGRTYPDVPEKQPTVDEGSTSLSSGESGERSGSDVQLNRVGKKTALNIRQKCLDLLASKSDEEMTEEDKALLRQYEGAGGLGEEGQSALQTLTAFYTPQKIVRKIWELTNKYVGHKGKLDVLEPSAATGRFMDDYPHHNYDAIEIDPTSARINRILHPNANVVEGAFQSLFFDKETGRIHQKQYTGKKYDVVIGNPPYTEYSGHYKKWGEGKKHDRYEEYFIERGLDTLKDGGIMSFIVPSSFLRSGENAKKIKELIASKGRLLEAWRLPNGTFSSTGVGTDIIVIRKEKGNASDFNDDHYFADHPGNILGDEVLKSNKFGKMEKYIQTKNGQTFDDAINAIDVTRHDVPKVGEKSMTQETKEKISVGLKGNKNAEKDVKAEPQKRGRKAKKEEAFIPNETHTMEEFHAKYNRGFKAHELDVWKATQFDGAVDFESLPAKTRKAFEESGDMCKLNGKVYHKLNYASGDIYKKLDQLEADKANGHVTDAEYARQKGYLEKAIPERKTTKNIFVSPLTQFAKDFMFHDEDGKESDSLINRFWYWAGVRPDRKRWQDFDAGVSKKDIPINATWEDIVDYIEGNSVRADRASYNSTKEEESMKADKRREQRRDAAEAIFKRFIEQGLSASEKEELESKWNRTYNANVDPDYTKIPLFLDGISKTFKGDKLEVKDIQLKGAAFLGNKGNGLLAYDVGVGKTLTGILATVQQLQTGRAKAPAICVPTAVYKNWIKEIRELFPNVKINELGNLGKEDSKKVPRKADGSFDLEGGLTIMSYEALGNITFKKETMEGQLASDLEQSQLFNSGDKKKSKRDTAKEQEKLDGLLGDVTKVDTNAFFFEDLGIDHITFDEVHNFKNIFGAAKAPERKDSRGNTLQSANEFADIKGGSSGQGRKAFAISQYIQAQNNGRNVFGLSATPFTNSPLEVYNILSLFARNRLKELGIYNIHEFMAQFAKLKSEWSVSTKGIIERKSVMKDFQNLSALQSLITEYIDKVDGEEAGVERPDKTTHLVNLPMSPLQELLMQAEQARMADRSRDNPAAAIVGINNTRISTVSPLLVKMDKYHDEIPEIAALMEEARKQGIVKSSPKLQFEFDSTVAIHKARPDLGQVIYMPVGNDHFKECVQYLAEKGISKDSIAIIEGGTPAAKREAIMADFNDPNGKIKVIIGSESIQEGINLNGNTAVIHNTMLGWNPSETTQVEGRIWRQGNKQKKVHVVYPQIVNSIDASMYQKHDEKRSRFNALWSYKGDALNVENINPEELKFDLIKDPQRRAKFKIDLAKEKLEGTVRDFEISIETLGKMKKDHAQYTGNIEYYQGKVEEYTQATEQYKARLDAILAKMPDEKDTSALSWEEKREKSNLEYSYNESKRNVQQYKTELKKFNNRISAIENTLKQMGNITLDTVDAEIANRQAEKEKVELEIKSIKEKFDQYVEVEKRKLMEEKSAQNSITSFSSKGKEVQTANTVNDAVKVFVKHLLSNLSEEAKELKKALAQLGTVVIVKRLNNKTGLFEYSKVVR